MRMLKEGQEAEEDVSWEDQQCINTFSKLNNRITEYEELYDMKKKHVESLEDAVNDLEVYELEMDDENELLDYRVGDCFVRMRMEEIKDRLAMDLERVREEEKLIQSDIDQTNKEMEELKKKLYAKFGTAIHLERTTE